MIAATDAAAQNAPAAPAVQLTLSGAREAWRAPMLAAAQQAAAVGRDWLGPHPTGTIAEVRILPPVWQGPGAMAVERQAAEAVIRSWWPESIADYRAAAMLDGFARYLHTYAIERLFDRRYLRRAYRVETVPALGDHVLWSVPTLRVPRRAATALRPTTSSDAVSRYAAMFATLESWLGVPALQSAMAAVARLPPASITGAAMVMTINDAVGQDLMWLFTAVADPAVTFDYAVTALSSTTSAACASSPCFETVVTVERLGDGQFTGSSRARQGGFQSGDGLALQVTFANDTDVWVNWDGRDRSRTFRFQGPAVAAAAVLDPERVVGLDVNPLNNSHVAPAPTNVPVRKWLARWLVWVQNAALTYGFFA